MPVFRKVRRSAALLIPAFLTLSACGLGHVQEELTTLQILTTPENALIQTSTGDRCTQSPCIIPIFSDDEIVVLVQAHGFEDQTVKVKRQLNGGKFAKILLAAALDDNDKLDRDGRRAEKLRRKARSQPSFGHRENKKVEIVLKLLKQKPNTAD